jgi:hypothetical protein
MLGDRSGCDQKRTVFLLKVRRCEDYASEVITPQSHIYNTLIISGLRIFLVNMGGSLVSGFEAH